jgi:dTDP-4-dehydrorhamnose 3,5-epimerase-like enzyme
MIEGVKLEKNPVFTDDRGLFFPLTISNGWVQSNISISKKYTFRGLHHQRGKSSQKKKITVITGSIIDFIVDLRMGNFKDTEFYKLLPGDTITVPEGCAHGFLALEDNTQIQYLVNYPYCPGDEISFNWHSAPVVREIIEAEVGAQGIDEGMILMSDKDFLHGVNLIRDYVEDIHTLTKGI